MKLEMTRVSAIEFAVTVNGIRVGTIAKDFNNWIGYFNKENPYRGKSEMIVFVEMVREFNRYKLTGSNDKVKAAQVIENLMSEARDVAKQLNALGETEIYAFNKVLI